MQNTAKCGMIVLLLTTYSFSHVQVDQFFNTLKEKYNCDSLPGRPFKMVSDGALTTLLKRDFSFLVINRDQSSATAGTGFTLDFNTDKTQATYNFAVVNPFSEARNYSAPIWILSGNVNAAYKAGVGSLFSNTKAGSSAGVLVKGSFILNKFCKLEGTPYYIFFYTHPTLAPYWPQIDCSVMAELASPLLSRVSTRFF